MHSPRRSDFILIATLLAAVMPCARAAEPVAAAPAVPPPMIGSSVFEWDKMVVKHTPVGARRDICDNPTATLERFECHITTLNPGLSSHPPHQHGQEEFIILREGTLDVGINGAITRVGPGSLFFFAANDWHNVNNVGTTPAAYLVFNLATAATRTAPKEGAAKTAAPGTLASAVWDWEKLEAKPTRNGERRELFSAPTVTCLKLSGHVTTLRGGELSHPGHRHPDEEIIVVKEGLMQATINGVVHRGGAGSIFFFASNDEHELRNAGETTATYYVFRVATDKTPTS